MALWCPRQRWKCRVLVAPVVVSWLPSNTVEVIFDWGRNTNFWCVNVSLVSYGRRCTGVKIGRSVHHRNVTDGDEVYSYAMVQSSSVSSCDYLGRIPANVQLQLDNLSWLHISVMDLSIRETEKKKGEQPVGYSDWIYNYQTTFKTSSHAAITGNKYW